VLSFKKRLYRLDCPVGRQAVNSVARVPQFKVEKTTGPFQKKQLARRSQIVSCQKNIVSFCLFATDFAGQR
jgi:hypothetical protein